MQRGDNKQANKQTVLSIFPPIPSMVESAQHTGLNKNTPLNSTTRVCPFAYFAILKQKEIFIPC